jgi:predicted transposase YbfD/YdcC
MARKRATIRHDDIVTGTAAVARAIENRLHWQLDVTFQEDQCRIRQGHADTNVSILRRTASRSSRACGGDGLHSCAGDGK